MKFYKAFFFIFLVSLALYFSSTPPEISGYGYQTQYSYEFEPPTCSNVFVDNRCTGTCTQKGAYYLNECTGQYYFNNIWTDSSCQDGCTQPPPPPPAPQCNSTCQDSSDCAFAPNGCTFCNPTTHTCTQPTPPPPPPAQCNSSCQNSSQCAQAPNGCTSCLPSTGGGLTCQPAPNPPPPSIQCNSSCQNSSQCAQAPNGCTVCRPNATGALTCQPAITPPPPGPQCNSTCVRDDQCTGDAARNGCTVCAPNASGARTCQPPGPQCNSSCVRDADCTGAAARNGCTICTPNANGTSTCQPPPAFNNDMCKCDGMEHGLIVVGGRTTITAFAKVEGTDVNLARVSGMRFMLLPVLPGFNTVLAEATTQVEVIVNTPTLVRYKAVWDLTVPSNLQRGVQYRIEARPVCQPRTNTVVNAKPATQNVLGITETKKMANFLDDLINFIKNLFGGSNNTQTATQTIAPPPASITATQDQGGDQLQLRAIYPAEVTDKRCQSIMFQFSNPN